MKLIGLRLTNFKSFVSCELDLNLDGLVAIVGPNGAGKSSLFTATEWVLYGSRRGRGSVPLRHDGAEDGEPCRVELDFDIAGRSYTVQRELGGTAELINRESGETLVTDQTAVSRAVAATLGMGRDVFCGTFYARQGEVRALDSRPERARQRRDQLEQLLGIDRLREAADLARRDVEGQRLVVETTSRQCPDLDELKEELKRRRKEAQAAAPAVAKTAGGLELARERKKKARSGLDAALKRVHEAAKRRSAAQEAAKALSEAQLRRDHLQQQLNEATDAARELAELSPQADRVEELAAREREHDLRRQTHERREDLRERQRAALATAAKAGDKLALADGSAIDPDHATEEVEETEESLGRTMAELERVVEQTAKTEAEVPRLESALRAAQRAAGLNDELDAVGDAEERLSVATTTWHRLQAEKEQLGRQVVEARELGAAVADQGPEAACPRCKRRYGDDWQSILDDYDQQIAAAQRREVELDSQLATTKGLLDTQRERATKAQELKAERSARGAVPTEAAAEVAFEEARERLGSLRRRRDQLSTERNRLESELKERRARRRTTEARRKQHDELVQERAQATQAAELYAEEVGGLTTNGYDPEAHEALKAELGAARQAATELAALKKLANRKPLLEKQVEAALEELETAETRHQQDRAALSEIGPTEDAVEEAQAELDRSDAAVEGAQSRLTDAQRAAERDDEAVRAAKERLNEARKQERHLKDERVELRWRQAVADALSAYREESSRKTRPTLARETTQLLAQVTRGQYASASLGEDYLLQIFDRGAEHPLRRFSGGEQDLANLCLRLALSRTLARQRGIETGFVMLDEVFGSQDAGRRASLLDQLRELGREFRQIFVISHLDDIKDHCDRHVSVARVGGVSGVQQG